MRNAGLCFGIALALVALPALAADAGVVTIVDGTARVMRGTVWYKLVAGAPFQEGDVVDADERTTVQVELTPGGTLNLVGPGALYAATLPARNDKADAAAEFALDRGWLKFVVPASAGGARLRTPTALLSTNEAVFVARADARVFELFIESGAAKIFEAGRTGREGAAHDAKAGEYWMRDGDKPFASERRAPVKFVASMPRHLTDRLASLAAKFKGKRPPLAVDREVTLAEADPWLAGPYRRAFARRLGGRLADPAFRKAVEANIAAYPDFDRVLHPEKYPASAAAPAPGAAPVPGAPATAAAPASPTTAAPKTATPPGTPPATTAQKAVPPTAVPPQAPTAPAKPGARTSLLPPPFTLALGIFRVPGSVL
jgi:hypothetical protein